MSVSESMDNKIDISVVICTYNRCDALGVVLRCLQAQVVPESVGWDVVVIDNNSKDRTKDVVDAFAAGYPHRFRYLFEGMQGKCHALNAGIAIAQGEILAFTDDDVSIDKEWLWHLKRAFDRYGCSGAGGRTVPLFLAERPAWLKTDRPFPFMNALVSLEFGTEALVCTRKHFFFGANMAFKKEVFERHGLFRLDLGPTRENVLGKGRTQNSTRGRFHTERSSCIFLMPLSTIL